MTNEELRLIIERDELKAEVEQLRAENAYLQKNYADAKADASHAAEVVIPELKTEVERLKNSFDVTLMGQENNRLKAELDARTAAVTSLELERTEMKRQCEKLAAALRPIRWIEINPEDKEGDDLAVARQALAEYRKGVGDE